MNPDPVMVGVALVLTFLIGTMIGTVIGYVLGHRDADNY